MIHIKETIIVEGKFDKERIKRICDAPILCTDGFQVFKSKELLNSIRHLAETTGIIVLTDSDRAGFLIRNYLKSCIGKRGTVKHAYIPSVPGKERRKEKPGKEGILGVEGIRDAILEDILKQFAGQETLHNDVSLTKTILYQDGLSGKESSLNLRKAVLKRLNLPTRLSPNAMIDIINKAGLYEEYQNAVRECKSE